MARSGGARLWVALVAVIGAAVGITGWLLWPRSAAPPVAHARQYLDVSACLLTGPAGVEPQSQAAPVWASMQSASLATHVMVSYLPASGQAAVPSLLNTMVQRRCAVIITSGVSSAQVAVAAKANPDQRFVLVTDSATTTVPANADVVSAASAPARIDQVLRALVGAA
jgi:hypothetical protein